MVYKVARLTRSPADIAKIGTYLVAERGCSTGILAQRQPLPDQWLAPLSLFLGIESMKIGQIGARMKTGPGQLDAAMIQSLVRTEKIEDLVANYAQVIVDECYRRRPLTNLVGPPY